MLLFSSWLIINRLNPDFLEKTFTWQTWNLTPFLTMSGIAQPFSPQQSADPAWWTKHLSCSKTYNWKQKTWLVNPKMNQNFPLCLLVCKCFYLDKRKGFRISYENLDLPSWLPISSNAGKESLQNTTSSVSLDLLH